MPNASRRIAVVTGAGSGVGRAVARRLAVENWEVVLLGRTLDSLNETLKLLDKEASRCRVHPCDIGNVEAVQRMATMVLTELGPPEVLVNSAGTNVPKRSLEQLSLADYHRMLDTNLNGAYFCVQAFLPEMRRLQRGTIVNVISDAGKQANAKAGPGYVVSKFGLTGLTQAINMEERQNGIRACAVFPGDIDTPLLERRPQPPTAEARQRMLQPDDVAECVLLAINLPARAVVEEILIRPGKS